MPESQVIRWRRVHVIRCLLVFDSLSVRKRPVTAGLFSYWGASERTVLARVYSFVGLSMGSGIGPNSRKNGNDDSPRTWRERPGIAGCSNSWEDGVLNQAE